MTRDTGNRRGPPGPEAQSRRTAGIAAASREERLAAKTPPLIVCVHATPRAIAPTHRLFAGAEDEFRRRDVVEERLFTCEADRDAGRTLFFDTLRRAAALRPAVILTTCSMYTRYLTQARREIGTPLVGIDEAMISRAAQRGGPFALVGSLWSAITLTRQAICDQAAILGTDATVAETRLVDADACATEARTHRLADELRELSSRVHTVVVVQLSLSGVAGLLSAAEQSRILTSAASALERLRAAVEESQL
jgi:hypothetical protein